MRSRSGASLNRIVLVRHGETLGESSIRYYGSTDVELSPRGCDQARRAGRLLPGDDFGLVITSPLSRAWTSAKLVMPNRSLQLEADLREVDFGDWEGLTGPEIEARDPIRYDDWKTGRAGFEYPRGEHYADFQARVDRVVDRILAYPYSSVLIVVHKGVIRAIVRRVTGDTLEGNLPELGEIIQLTRSVRGEWSVGRNASVPPCVPDRRL